ncbi:hypothetical protein KKA02_04605 [Patescibacteria group bacterium]|nr:hypothetical protein [Patescibacteria group bacterium]
MSRLSVLTDLGDQGVSLADDFGQFAILAKRIQEKLITVMSLKKSSDLKLKRDTILAKQEIAKGKGKSFDSVEDLVKDLDN